MSDPPNLRRRRVLALSTSAAGLGLAGCLANEADKSDDSSNDTAGAGLQPLDYESPAAFEFAGRVDGWAWFPSDDSLWSRSADPFDFRQDGGRWMARPADDGAVRCHVQSDEPPGNAGIYRELGNIGDVAAIEIEAETVASDSGDQQLLFAIYLDRDGDEEFFTWEERGGREAFIGLGSDAEAVGTVPVEESIRLDEENVLELIAPSETADVTLTELRRGEVDGIDPVTGAALQVSVVGSGEGNVEELLVRDITVEAVERPTVADTGWAMCQHDRHNTGHNTGSTGPTGPVSPEWTFQTGGPVRSSPAVGHGRVYVGSNDGTLYALDAATGEKAWTADTGGPVVSSPAIYQDRVYVGSDDHHVYAFDHDTGEQLWAFETGGPIRSSPTVDDDMGPHATGHIYVFVGSDDGSAYIIEGLTGEVYHEMASDGRVVSPPMLYKQQTSRGPINIVAVFTSTDGYAYTYKDHPRFRGPEPHPFDLKGAGVPGPVGIPTGTIFYANEDGRILATEGNPVWEQTVEGPVRHSPTIRMTYLDLVFVTSTTGKVHAFANPEGELEWERTISADVQTTTALAGDLLYLGSDDGRVHALAADTGDTAWATDVGAPVRSSPAVADQRLYVGQDDGVVVALTDE